MRKLAIVSLALLLAACSSDEIVPTPYLPTDAWDAYRHGLVVAGLDSSALGRDWLAAADRAVGEPVQITLPYQEDGTFDPAAGHATGYRFTAARGQRIEIVAALAAGAPARVFLDLFRESEEGRVHVATADDSSGRLAFEPRRDATYVLRVQPELLRGGSYTLTLGLVPTLEFPVSEHTVSDIGSPFGAERDGGRRSHHGVDIFAPRNTPVVATSRARVRRVGEQRLGGNVIWLYDEQRSLNLYYAHLESQAVAVGEWVEPGQVIGAVGNSGNARTTPTHLHFGVYARGEGPLDPDRFLRPARGSLPRLRADTSLIGAWARAGDDGVRLRLAPTTRGDDRRQLQSGTEVRVWAATGAYYRVALADGTPGFVAAADLDVSAFSTAGTDAE